ncbi:hypothetical protein BZA77DRAFT_297273 [Pyronema omphalodes]|nr:hypothetical protein BZA77DRAFT_297273 [Pyronema omphalodes]
MTLDDKDSEFNEEELEPHLRGSASLYQNRFPPAPWDPVDGPGANWTRLGEYYRRRSASHSHNQDLQTPVGMRRNEFAARYLPSDYEEAATGLVNARNDATSPRYERPPPYMATPLSSSVTRADMSVSRLPVPEMRPDSSSPDRFRMQIQGLARDGPSTYFEPTEPKDPVSAATPMAYSEYSGHFHPPARRPSTPGNELALRTAQSNAHMSSDQFQRRTDPQIHPVRQQQTEPFFFQFLQVDDARHTLHQSTNTRTRQERWYRDPRTFDRAAYDRSTHRP